MKSIWLPFFLLCILVVLMPSLRAQDNHYNWSKYGSRNSILYNANLSRFEDQSAVIVNPATLASAQQSSFNFNTNAVGINNIKFKNGLGEGFTITTGNINVLPAMASGVIKPKPIREKNWVLGYSLYSTNTDNLTFSDRVEDKLDIINETESPGAENYLAQYNVDNSIDEGALVVGIGWPGKHGFTWGISQTFIYTLQEFNQKYSAYVIPDESTGATLDLAGTNYNYHSNFYKLFTYTKFGFTARLKHWDFGLTVATPTLGIFGEGHILADLNLINIRLDEDLSTPRETIVANGEFDDLPVRFRYPMQCALGISRPFGKVRMYGSVSWHSNLKAYNVLEPGDEAFFQPPSEENAIYTNQLLSLWAINRSIVNGAVAADWLVRENYHFLFSVRTDYNYGAFLPDRDGFNSALKQWNNYHLTFGTQRVIGSSEWVIGLQYIFAKRNDCPQPISFADPTEGNYFGGEVTTGTVTSRGFQLLLSYTYTIGGGSR